MRMRLWVMAIPMVFAGAFLAGCSGVNVQPISVDQINDPSVSGVRFYQSEPYLLVTSMGAPQRAQNVMFNSAGMQGGQAGSSVPGPMQWGPNGNSRMGPPQPGNHPNANVHNGNMQNNAGPGPRGFRGMRGQFGPGGGNRIARGTLVLRAAQQPQEDMLTLQIIYLPDYSHPYVAQINGNGNSVVLANGWELLGINASGPLGNPPPVTAVTRQPGVQVLGMMGGAGGGMGRPMFLARSSAGALGLMPGLYQFVFDSKTGELTGLKRVTLTIH